jgi:hypothetical protein
LLQPGLSCNLLTVEHIGCKHPHGLLLLHHQTCLLYIRTVHLRNTFKGFLANPGKIYTFRGNNLPYGSFCIRRSEEPEKRWSLKRPLGRWERVQSPSLQQQQHIWYKICSNVLFVFCVVCM